MIEKKNFQMDYFLSWFSKPELKPLRKPAPIINRKKTIARTQGLVSSQQCVDMMTEFLESPPRWVQFNSKKIRSCTYDVPKVLIRMIPLPFKEDTWDYLFGWKANHKGWHLLGGSSATISVARKPTLSTKQVLQMMCQALVKRGGNAWFEVTISLQEREKRCDMVNWDLDTELSVKRKTTKDHKDSILTFDPNSSYDPDKFESSGMDLTFMYDFSKNRQRSIWQ